MAHTPSHKSGFKRKHVTLTITDKLEILKRYEKGVKASILAQEYNIGISTVYDMKKQSQELKAYASARETMTGCDKRKTLRKPALETLDEALYHWFKDKRSEGKPISGPMLIEKAHNYKRKMNIETEIKFSNGWLRNFKTRHGIRILSTGMNYDAELQGVEEHTDEDIMQSVLNPTKVEEDVLEEEKRITWSEAVYHLECFVKFAEKSHSYNIAEVMNLHTILKDCHTKRQKDIKQADIRDLFRKAAIKVESTPRPKEQQREPERGSSHETISAELAECMADDPPPVMQDSSVVE